MNQQIKIIGFLIFFFVLSSAWLFEKNALGLNPDYKKDWWVIYFQEARGNNLSFVLENHSTSRDFRWEVISDDVLFQNGEVQVASGGKKNIEIELKNPQKKISVRVSDERERKEIYKNFEN